MGIAGGHKMVTGLMWLVGGAVMAFALLRLEFSFGMIFFGAIGYGAIVFLSGAFEQAMYHVNALKFRRSQQLAYDTDMQLKALLDVLVAMSIADDILDTSESMMISAIYAKTTGIMISRQDVQRRAREISRQKIDVVAVLTDLENRIDRSVKEMILKSAILVIRADMLIDLREVALLDAVAAALKFPPRRYTDLKANMLLAPVGADDLSGVEETKLLEKSLN